MAGAAVFGSRCPPSLKIRWIVGYFLILASWAVVAGLNDGQPAGGILFSVAVLTALAVCSSA